MEIRIARPSDMLGISSLADHVFRSRRPGHMAEDFPYLYEESNARHWFIALDEKRIVSIVGAMIWPAVIAGSPTHAASVGSVATDPEYRGQGLATQLLSLAETTLAAEGARLMLISGDLPLYTKFGARPIGRVAWYSAPTNLPKHPSYHVRPLHPENDAPHVARLNQMRATRFGRDIATLQVMLALQPITGVEQGTKVALLVEQEGQPVTYIILTHRPFQGRGPSRVTEWAGDPLGLLYALTTVTDWPLEGIHIPVLEEDLALRGDLLTKEPLRLEPVSWLCKVIDGTGLVADLAPVWAERTPSSLSVTASADNSQYLVTVGQEHLTVDPATLTEWMFNRHVPNRPPLLSTFWPIPALWPEGLNFI